MSFRYSIGKVSMFDLSFNDAGPRAGDEEACRKELRDIERYGQTVRIPISMSNEVLGEYHHFNAMIELGFDDIEVIRCESTQKDDIDFARKIATKFPIARRKYKR